MPHDPVAGAQRRLDVATGELAKAIKNGETGTVLRNRERNVLEADGDLQEALRPKSAAETAQRAAQREETLAAIKARDELNDRNSILEQRALAQRAETAKAMKAYRTAARNVGKIIDELAAGNEDNAKLSRAFDGLFAKSSKADIRGDQEALAEAWALETALRKRLPEAREAGYQARQSGRSAEITRLKEKERDERYKMDPALRAYQDELKRTLR